MHEPDENARTRLASSADKERGPDLRTVFARIYPRLFAPVRPGYQLFAVGQDGEVRSAAVPATVDDFVIVGRHTKCDLQVSDELVSLRHLLVRSVVTEDGELALRILDLFTQLGFRTVDGVETVSAIVRGPAAFSVGPCAFFALPYGLRPERVLPAAKTTHAQHVPRVRNLARELDGPPESVLWRTQVTSLPSPTNDAEPCDGEGRTVRIILQSAAGTTQVLRSESQLQRGMLIGRYARCGAGHHAADALSRVHVLLLGESGSFVALDTASTNGMLWRGSKVRRAVLDSRDELFLAPGCAEALTLHWNVER